MKIAHFKSDNGVILYFQPFGWDNLSRLFTLNSACKTELFVGYKEGEKFYVDQHGCSSSLDILSKTVDLRTVYNLIRTLKIRPYEFIILINEIRISTTISGGVIISGGDLAINNLFEKLDLTLDIITQATDCLAVVKKKRVSEIAGRFKSVITLREYLYDEAMEMAIPGYSQNDSPF
jgi:hypothetical protein